MAAVKQATKTLVEDSALTGAAAAAAMAEIVAGAATPAQIASFLTALAVRGETSEVVHACAQVLRREALPFPPTEGLVDIVGTGGDGIDTFNVSTCASFVVAGAGAKVAKHGNRAASSKCGSADLLQALGANLELDGDALHRVLDGSGFCFLFAQKFHPGMRHVAPVRKELAMRTVFNIMGPLINPAGPKAILAGVSKKKYGPIFAETFILQGYKRAMVVHGANGMDEISPVGPTFVWMVEDGVVRESQISPADFGLPEHSLDEVRGGDPADNAKTMRALLSGTPGPVANFVTMNAAAALFVAGLAKSFPDGVAVARDAIASGKAMAVLDKYIQLSAPPAAAGPDSKKARVG